MDEKTAELRDIFIDATGGETATERQEARRGSLADGADDVDARVAELVGAMRDRYDFDSSLPERALCRVVEGYHAGESDGELADRLGVGEDAVFEARTDLHLVDDRDRDAPFDLAALRAMVVEGVPPADRAAELDADEATVRRYARVVEADLASTRANDRFRDAFAELLTDADLSERLASDAREDGLREATEDIETDVSF